MHIKPKKSLGQNFLIDKNIQRKIISACNFNSQDTLLEIGSGSGEFTQLLAKNCLKVYALEIDQRLLPLLKENLKNDDNIEIIQTDILKFDFKRFFKKIKINSANTKNKIKIFGNIPYYISTPIIERVFEFRKKIDCLYLTVQKEFAQRLIASCGSKDYASISCFVQYFSQPKILFPIKRNSFYPVPGVDSVFLKISLREKAPVKVKDKELFFRIIRAAFNKRRKTLKNSLKEVLPQQNLENFFSKFKISPNVRPERLSLDDFAKLSSCLPTGRQAGTKP
ncbi:MAG: 16S rRNA (adenine(1518)-N(6)/adenine(1519)-N(6))-dimethyltransferase RsmA [Candidatus Omnitrophota bacterium]